MKKRHSSSSFQSILFVICIIIAVAFLIQLGVDTLQLGSPTGAVVSVYELRDTFANIIGPPATGTKIITGANPTQTASKVANYLASDYILCGNGRIDEGEDCEPSFIYSTTAEAIMGVQCGNCKFAGDGRVTHISSEGLMEECDPGDADYIPSIAPVNSCSDNGVCQSDGTCPAGSYSTNLCAYGIYKTIVDAFEDSYYPYLYASGNLLCEEGESVGDFDCSAFKSDCGITISDMAEVEFEGSQEELIDVFAQEYGLSAGFAEVLLDAPSITVLYNEPLSTYAQFRLEFTMFPNSSVLVDILSVKYFGSVVNSDIGGYRVYVSNASNEWVWYAGNVLYTLSYEGYGTVSLTMGEKQQGNVVLTAYLNQFGSDVGAGQLPPPPVCGNSIVESGEQCDDGNNVNGDGCSSVCSWKCIDTDNGNDVYHKGIARKENVSYVDYCLDSMMNTSLFLKEYFCSENLIASQDVDCSMLGRLTCYDGRCIILPAYVIFTNQNATRLFEVMGDTSLISNISLINRSVSGIMEEGETKQYTISGIVYEVNVLIVSDTSNIVKFKVNSTIGNALKANYSEIYANGAVIGIKQILPHEAEEVIGGDLVEFYLGTTKPIICGDSVCETGENLTSCPADCHHSCGNSMVEFSEECDDGNANDGDGCSSLCLWECIETDSGNNPYQQGIISNGTATHTDYCFNASFNTSAPLLKEYFCSGNLITSQNINCLTSEIGYLNCSNGACVNLTAS